MSRAAVVHVARLPLGEDDIRPTFRRERAALKRGVLPRALKIESIPESDLQTLIAYAQRLSGTSEPVASSPSTD